MLSAVMQRKPAGSYTFQSRFFPEKQAGRCNRTSGIFHTNS